MVIVGPMTKVDPATIPQRPNLHWMGGRDYQVLPNYVKKFDVCLMPFALNEATEYINPTKALEYMATERPIVSTPVEDVVLQFSSVVKISKSSEDFVHVSARKRRSRPDQTFASNVARLSPSVIPGSPSWKRWRGTSPMRWPTSVPEAAAGVA